MANVETRAVILRTYKLAEADKIAVCLTEAQGMVRGVARGARRLKSRYGASLEVCTLVHLSYFEKEGRDLVSLKSAEIIESAFALAGDAEMLARLDYLSELLIAFMPPHEANVLIFRMVTRCLEALRVSPERHLEITRYFELWLLRLSGFLPDVRRCAKCGCGVEDVRMSLGIDSSVRCSNCAYASDMVLMPDLIAHIGLIQRIAPELYAQREVAFETMNELSGFIQILMRRALERAPQKGQKGKQDGYGMPNA